MLYPTLANRLYLLVGLVSACLVSHCIAHAETARFDPIPGAEKAFAQAKTNYSMHPADLRATWELGRSTYELADILPGNARRAVVAQEGIDACKKALVQAPDSAPLHYYLGLNLGELARTKTLGALRLVDQMEKEFLKSIELDASFDYAGAERSLGMLYRDAPALASIGSKSKARTHLQRALALAPGYPENRLDMVESELKWGDRKAARRELKVLDEGWEAARSELAGPDWIASWADWATRLEKARKALDEPARLETPRH
jgi:tetratricopeptide (TPR) repeat protein